MAELGFPPATQCQGKQHKVSVNITTVPTTETVIKHIQYTRTAMFATNHRTRRQSPQSAQALPTETSQQRDTSASTMSTYRCHDTTGHSPGLQQPVLHDLPTATCPHHAKEFTHTDVDHAHAHKFAGTHKTSVLLRRNTYGRQMPT